MEKRLTGTLAAILIAGATAAGATEDQGEQQGMQHEEQGQAEQAVKGTIATSSGTKLYLQTEDGVVIPFKLDKSTKYEGDRAGGKAIESAGELKNGDDVRVSFSRSGMENTAKEVELKQPSGQELSGTVHAAKDDTLYIDHEGAYVPLKVGSGTSFAGKTPQGKSVDSVSQIQKGDEVRATFRVRNNTENEAEKIEVESGGDSKK